MMSRLDGVRIPCVVVRRAAAEHIDQRRERIMPREAFENHVPCTSGAPYLIMRATSSMPIRRDQIDRRRPAFAQASKTIGFRNDHILKTHGSGIRVIVKKFSAHPATHPLSFPKGCLSTSVIENVWAIIRQDVLAARSHVRLWALRARRPAPWDSASSAIALNFIGTQDIAESGTMCSIL